MGTYNATSGKWSSVAPYTLQVQNNGKIKVHGAIPWDEVAGIFPEPGYRLAVRIAKESITAKSQLPSGNILKVTNTDFDGGYNVSTKNDFEDDGSLIVLVAPTAETLDAYDREVKIAWSIAGGSVADSDYTTYTFDLSEATLATH